MLFNLGLAQYQDYVCGEQFPGLKYLIKKDSHTQEEPGGGWDQKIHPEHSPKTGQQDRRGV